MIIQNFENIFENHDNETWKISDPDNTTLADVVLSLRNLGEKEFKSSVLMLAKLQRDKELGK